VPADEDAGTIASLIKQEDATEHEQKPSTARQAKAQRRIARARARRKAALDKAAPKSLNPYASDDSDFESEPIAGSDDEIRGGEEAAELDDEDWAKAVQAGKVSKGERLLPIDHSAIKYRPFRKVRRACCSRPYPVELRYT
jgi:hypothetical protein